MTASCHLPQRAQIRRRLVFNSRFFTKSRIALSTLAGDAYYFVALSYSGSANF